MHELSGGNVAVLVAKHWAMNAYNRSGVQAKVDTTFEKSIPGIYCVALSNF